MKKSALLIILFGILLGIGLNRISASSVMTLYSPLSLSDTSSHTILEITNTSTDTANVVIQYYRADGSLSYTNAFTTIMPSQTAIVSAEDEPLPTVFRGSAVISSDKTITGSAVVEFDAGHSVSSDLIQFPTLSRDISPVVKSTYFTSLLVVQNAESSPANVFLNFSNGCFASASVAGYSSAEFDLNTIQCHPDFFIGSVTVSSGNEIAITGYDVSNATGLYYPLGYTPPVTNLYNPLNISPGSTETFPYTTLELSNTSLEPAFVTLRYYSASGSNADSDFFELDPSETVNLDITELPFLGNFRGSVVITSTNSITGSATLNDYAMNTVTDTLIQNPTSVQTISPVVKGTGFTSLLVVQNAEPQSSNAFLNFDNGCFTSAPLPSNTSAEFDLSTLTCLPNGYNGSVTISSGNEIAIRGYDISETTGLYYPLGTTVPTAVTDLTMQAESTNITLSSILITLIASFLLTLIAYRPILDKEE